MLKFKKTQTGGTPITSPIGSPNPSPRRPKLLTRLDSIGGPVELKRVSLFQNDSDEQARSSSGGEFETPESKLRDITKKKLNKERKKLLKHSAKKKLNILSSKDFFARQQELKIWVSETTGKDVSVLTEAKLKEYFKKFTDKWNKKKLPQKYYRGVDLHSSPLPAVQSPLTKQAETTPQSDSSSLWIAPPIPTFDPLSYEDESSTFVPPPPPAPATPCSTFTSQKFATISRASPAKPSQLCIEELSTKTKTPPKPPVRRHDTVLTSTQTTFGSSHSINGCGSSNSIAQGSQSAVRRRGMGVITTLPAFGSSESITSCGSNSGVARAPRPRMGSIMSSMRRSPHRQCAIKGKEGSSTSDVSEEMDSVKPTERFCLSTETSKDDIRTSSSGSLPTSLTTEPQISTSNNDEPIGGESASTRSSSDSLSSATSTEQEPSETNTCLLDVVPSDNNKDNSSLASENSPDNHPKSVETAATLPTAKEEKETSVERKDAVRAYATRRSGEKRSISMLSANTAKSSAGDDDALTSAQPLAKKRTVWAHEVEKCEEFFV